MNDVLDKCENLAEVKPGRVVVHKTSLYEPEEERGYGTPQNPVYRYADLVRMRSTAFRLITTGMLERWRGTMCTVGDETYLFTSAYVHWWDEYPGPTFQRRCRSACDQTDMPQRA